jgi:transposase
MDTSTYEALTSPLKSGAAGHLEVTVRAERRRRWQTEDKLRIVRETLTSGVAAKAVADRHGISTGLLYTWRKQMLATAMAGFMPVEVVSEPTAPRVPSSAPTAASASGGGLAEAGSAKLDAVLEVDLSSGTRVRVGNGADAKLLRSVFAALDGR